MIQKDELTIADLKGAGLEWLKVHYNNDVELQYHVCQLKAAVLSEAQWNSDEGDVSKPRSFKRHMSKSTKPHPCFYNNDYSYLVDLNIEEKYTTSITKHYAVRYYKEGIDDIIPERWSKEVHRYHFEALNVRRSDDKEYELSYANLPRLSVNDVEDIRTVIKKKVEDIQLGVESYQRTLNLTKPTMFFEGIDQRIPFTMTNKLGSGNKRLKGRDWTDYDVKSSKEMLKKIDEILRHIQRRLKEYVGGRPKTVNPLKFKMDDPNITMEEYIKLQAEKAQRHDFEANFPSIVYNDALTSNENVSPEPTMAGGYVDVRVKNFIQDDRKELVSGRNQGRISYGDNGRSNASTNESSSQALVAQDGLGGYDWQL
ncbi:hypothetical protein Tco_0678267 [Tanacetum coccineum]|uniref:Uncharacterized protein n=1 Tax=Tanacetum coccineum TaxID=301880 RepID=A0ABQ4XEL8_9ASTR